MICGIRVMAVRSAVFGVFVAGDAGTADLRMNVLLFDPALGFWENSWFPQIIADGDDAALHRNTTGADGASQVRWVR